MGNNLPPITFGSSKLQSTIHKEAMEWPNHAYFHRDTHFDRAIYLIVAHVHLERSA